MGVDRLVVRPVAPARDLDGVHQDPPILDCGVSPADSSSITPSFAIASMGVVAGILLAAIPFGLLHFSEYGNSWRHAVLISGAGVAFGWMRHRTGSTKASTLMHAAYNVLFFAALWGSKL